MTHANLNAAGQCDGGKPTSLCAHESGLATPSSFAADACCPACAAAAAALRAPAPAWRPTAAGLPPPGARPFDPEAPLGPVDGVWLTTTPENCVSAGVNVHGRREASDLSCSR